MVDTFENDEGDRYVIGTHDADEALAAFRHADRNQPDWAWTVRAGDVAAFEYGWYLRIEPPHPDYAVEYQDVPAGTACAVPGIRLPEG